MNQKIISENLFPESRLLKKLKSKIYPVITQLRSREEKVLNKFKLKLEKRNITFNIVEGLGQYPEGYPQIMPEFPVPINQPFKNIFFEKKDYLSTYDKSFNEKFKNHFAQETLGHFVDNIEQHCVHGYGIIMTRRILKNDQHGFEIRVIEDGDNLGGRLPSEEIKIGVTRKMGGEGGYGLARIKERVKEMFIFSKRENDNALFWSSYYPHQNFVVEDFPINIGRITIVRF